MDVVAPNRLLGSGTAAGHRHSVFGLAGAQEPQPPLVAGTTAAGLPRRRSAATHVVAAPRRRCPGCWDAGLRTVYGRGGEPVFTQPCNCHAGLLQRVLAGIRDLPAAPQRLKSERNPHAIEESKTGC